MGWGERGEGLEGEVGEGILEEGGFLKEESGGGVFEERSLEMGELEIKLYIQACNSDFLT